jgi:hypothetical protein|tara:strand:- start:540 stop:839 length:300 start_codon:yes stop_codon:yes gene_type:complete
MAPKTKTKSEAERVLKILYKQLSGKLTEEDLLIPPVIIKGSGPMWAYDPFSKTIVNIERGSIVYILEKEYDLQGRTLIYCVNADIICVDPEEIEELGFN